jgi:hypothetical protein
VKRLEPPYWRQQGWQRAVLDFCPGYKGYYRTPYGSYRGEIKEEDTEGYDFFILKPPEETQGYRLRDNRDREIDQRVLRRTEEVDDVWTPEITDYQDGTGERKGRSRQAIQDLAF